MRILVRFGNGKLKPRNGNSAAAFGQYMAITSAAST
jgi:hypothetical protein